MTETMSPRLSRFMAVTLLLVATWLSANLLYFAMSRRLGLQAEVTELRQRFEELRKRRVDIQSLRVQLSTLSTSAYVRNAAIMATTDRAALARLQQITRKAIEDVQGKLLSLVELAGDRSSSTVGVQVRARIGEPSLAQWISLVENGEPRLYVEEISMTSRVQPTEPVL